jgi:hypothetical protein
MNNNISVVVAPSWELAQTIQDPTITVEAEWGGIVLEGSAFTACHHQPGQESWPAPCNNTSIPTIEQGTIVLSHLDHDCIAGTLRAMGCAELFTPEFNSFWQLAEDCDKNGPKVLKDHSQEDQDRMNAIWAHLKTLPFTPRDKIKDVTETILKCREVFRKILNGDETLLYVGRQSKASPAEKSCKPCMVWKQEVTMVLQEDDVKVDTVWNSSKILTTPYLRL